MIKFIKKLDELPRQRAIQAAIGFTIVLVILDYVIKVNPGLDVLYLIPLSVITWWGSGTAGAALACVCVGVWLGHNILSQTQSLLIYWQAVSKLTFFLAYVIVLEKFKQSRVSQSVLTHTDDLTGIANRFAFYEIGARELQRCRRHGQCITLAYINCDNFQVFNEHFSFATGDELLRVIAQTLLHTLRQTDQAARLTGDEFAVLLPATDATKSIQVMAKIHNRLIEVVNKRKWPVTFSIAITTFNTLPESVDAMNGAADKLLLAVRKAGGNRMHHEVF